MAVTKGHLIDHVAKGSPAYKAGIKPGWELLRIDNQEVRDIIDFKIMESDTSVRLLLKNDLGSLHRLTIHKPVSLPLGLRFNPPTMAGLQHCRNNCIFCFINQNPPGLRNPLYIKDDDYRLSFLYGNFITLNRMTDEEIERIKKLQLSPLYVSVQATNPDLRRIMFNSRHAEKGIDNLKKLVSAGIQIHAQVVLCPGYNTGAEMKRTISDLEQLGEGILSIALVPVGLTRHRSGLPALKRYDSAAAYQLVAEVAEMQEYFFKKRGSRFVFLADEFYNLAGMELPEDYEYENYPQLENGVGLARQFLEQLKSVKDAGIKILPQTLTAAVVSGYAAKPQVTEMVNILNRIENLTVKPIFTENRFFGEEVTVSGLLTGSDMLAGLEGKTVGDVVFIPAILLKENSRSFLDDLKISDLEKALQVPVHAVNGPWELFEQILEMTGRPAPAP